MENNKILYPTFTEFSGHVNIYKDSVFALLKCNYCGGEINVKLNGDTSKVKDDEIKQRVLRVAQERHDCMRKAFEWSDKDILNKKFKDFVEGYEKLKEKEDKK